MKQLIENIKQQQLSESEQTDQVKWELLKYEIRKFAIFESNLNSEANFNEYTKCKKDLELIYERIAEGVKIRSKCQWYEEGEKSTKFFLNLEKKINKKIKSDPLKHFVRKLKVNGKERVNRSQIFLSF